MKRILALCFSTLLIGGCSMLSPQPEPTEPTSINWNEHFAAVNALQDWRASGKISITVEDKVQSAKLVWQQNDDQFHLAFIGPLGQSGPILEGNQDSATLTIPKEAPIKGSNPSELLEQRLGWKLPVESARYWIKGIPSPLSESNVVLKDEKLAQLKQAGWEINYGRYRNIEALSMPAKITITHPKLKLKLALYNWELDI